MNLDELTKVWSSQDLAPLHGVDQTLLHQLLRQEEAKLEQQRRKLRRITYAMNALLLILVALFFAILIDPNQPLEFSSRRVVWDYVVGCVGLAAGVTLAGAILALRRSQQARLREFGDSLRDHLRRRIAQIDDAARSGRRLEWTMVVSMLICAKAMLILAGRIRHVPVPWSEMIWPSPWWMLLIALVCLEMFRWAPRRWREQTLPRKCQLEALLKELDAEL